MSDDVADKIGQEAAARSARHAGRFDQRPLSDGYELVGLRGEQAFGEAFDLEVNLAPGDDGGRDFRLPLIVRVQEFPIDVKCFRKPYHLIVEQGKVRPQTIYVLAWYSDEFDRAALLGWEWGVVLLRQPARDFGYGVLSHAIPREQLRDLRELHERRWKRP